MFREGGADLLILRNSKYWPEFLLSSRKPRVLYLMSLLVSKPIKDWASTEDLFSREYEFGDR